jgi:alpha-beta hydrolase superfamily lysophospholipase
MESQDQLRLKDGTRLRLHAWPGGEQPHGRVLIVHGLGEHGARYAHVAQALNRAGWAVHAYDHRGHGDSDGVRGAVAAHHSLCADLAEVIDDLRTDEGPFAGPFVLLGHSMGGLVAARFVAEALAARPAAWSRPVDGLVLSSPALDTGAGAGQRLQLWLGERLMPDRPMPNGLKPEWVSRDAQTVHAYVADPKVHDRITARLARFIVDEGAPVIAAAPRWKLPTLLMWAGADRCVAPAGSAAFAAAAPAAVLQHRCFDGLAHEIFNEPERAEVLAHLAGWLAGIGGPTLPGARRASA